MSTVAHVFLYYLKGALGKLLVKWLNMKSRILGNGLFAASRLDQKCRSGLIHTMMLLSAPFGEQP